MPEGWGGAGGPLMLPSCTVGEAAAETNREEAGRTAGGRGSRGWAEDAAGGPVSGSRDRLTLSCWQD